MAVTAEQSKYILEIKSYLPWEGQVDLSVTQLLFVQSAFLKDIIMIIIKYITKYEF